MVKKGKEWAIREIARIWKKEREGGKSVFRIICDGDDSSEYISDFTPNNLLKSALPKNPTMEDIADMTEAVCRCNVKQKKNRKKVK